ncbi:MAG TPA: hypothetical protein VM755_06285 [Stellaceae bacterium]|nr:hypothetical protein [Stellaceae bacterium]
MAVEDHPFFPVWKKRLEDLLEAKKAQREGRASQQDVDKAQAEYDKIAAEV